VLATVVRAHAVAEIVQLRRKGAVAAPQTVAASTPANGHASHSDNSQLPASILTMREQSRQEPGEAIDPVCYMIVEIATARYKSEYDGQTYYFCAPGCKRTFEKNPKQFVTTY
jgi:YHS domain-containing protein